LGRQDKELTKDLVKREFSGIFFGDNGKVGMVGKILVFQPKDFPDQTFDSIPCYCSTYFPAYGETQPCGTVAFSLPINNKVRGMAFLPQRAQSPEIFRAAKSNFLRKSIGDQDRKGQEIISYLAGMVTERTLRPRARRRLRTVLPAWVFIRRRKPWVRLRLMRLG